ncbi:MAG: FAD-binding protein [Raoultibacter sp.]|jgi:fumarate reductase flavoprotein subunit
MEKVSRRRFLFGAAAVTAGAAVAPLAVGCSSQAKTESGNETTSGGRWSWSLAPQAIDDSKIGETISCEILICGYGSAGVPAATYAAANGADVVVLTAGNAVEALGQECAVFNSPLDGEYGASYDPTYWMKRLVMEGLGAIDMPATGVIYERSGDAMHWLTEHVKDEMPYVVGTDRAGDGINDASHDESAMYTHLSYTWPAPDVEDATSARYKGFPMFLNAAAKRAEQDGARVLFSTPLEQLVQDESGAVIGGIGKNKDGEYVKVLASKGVVLATGDFHQDEEMLECFCPDMCGDLFSRNPNGNCLGGGHKAAYWAGAYLNPAGSYKLGLSWPHNHESSEFPPQAWSNIPYLRVNKNGKRYTCEQLASHGTYGTAPICLADARQPGSIGYQILDSKYGELIDPAKFEAEVARDAIYVADTLEELAEIIEVDVDGLLETVKRYNELCEKGIDEDCGVDAKFLASTSVTNPPFYCMHHPVYKQNVGGGLSTNEYQQVYDANQQVIPGLYAAGLIRSGWSGHFYARSGFTGTSKMTAMVGGMICVKNILGTEAESFS